VNRKRVMMERKCFGCRGSEHIACNYRNKENRRKAKSTLMSSNKFKVLKSRVMNVGEESGREIRKDRKMILREEKLKEKKKKLVEVRKIEGGKISREMTVKIGLKQQEDEEGIVVEALLNSSMIGLIMSLEFARKKKLDRLIYVRNVNSIFNYKEPIEHMVEIELFFKEHKERMEIDVINRQK